MSLQIFTVLWVGLLAPSLERAPWGRVQSEGEAGTLCQAGNVRAIVRCFLSPSGFVTSSLDLEDDVQQAELLHYLFGVA